MGGEDIQLWYTSSTDGNIWATDQQLLNVSLSASPALVVFNNRLYCFYNGSGSGAGKLWYTSSPDGTSSNWAAAQPVIPAVGITNRPALAVFNNTLYCYHQGTGGQSNQLWYTSSPDGAQWVADQPMTSNVALLSSPALAVWLPG